MKISIGGAQVFLVLTGLTVFFIFQGLVATSATAQPLVPSVKISGYVLSAKGTPVVGEMVTAENGKTGIEVTRFTDERGHYLIDRLQPGPYRITAKGGKWAALTQEINNLAADQKLADFKLEKDPDFLKRLPSSQWYSLLPEGEMKKKFILFCDICHEMSYTRVVKDGKARTEKGWKDAFIVMHGMDVYHNIPPEFNDDKYARWLAQNFTNDKIAKLKPPVQMKPKLGAKVRYTEYPLPDADELPHDLVVGPDGRIWITSFMHDMILALDPATGAYEKYEVKDPNNKDWAQVRALKFDRKGILWAVLGGTKSVVRLDTKSRKFETFDVGMYAHSLDIDSHDNIWINDYFTKPERIAKLDSQSGKVTNYAIASANLSEAEGLPLPYGLVVDGKDRVWSTQLDGNTLVRFDIATGKSKLYRMPVAASGPRRQSIGKNGEIWVPEWSTGHLDKFDPETEKFTRYDMKGSAKGFYAVETDPRTGKVWLTGALSSTMLLFDPATASFEEYPVPTEPGFERHIAIDPKNGDLWTAYSSLPAVHPKILRIEVEN